MPLTPPAGSELARARFDALRAEGNIASADGSVVVSGAVLMSLDKTLLLEFVKETRAQIIRLLALPYEGKNIPVLLKAIKSDGGPGRCRIHVVVQRHAGVVLHVENIEKMSRSQLVEALCAGMLRYVLSMETNSVGDPPHDFPAWFSKGVAALLDVVRLQEDVGGVVIVSDVTHLQGLVDEAWRQQWYVRKFNHRNRHQEHFDAIWKRWSHGELPPAFTLVESFSPYASADVALAAQLVAWLIEDPGTKGERMGTLRQMLQRQAWSAREVARGMGITSLSEFDWAWDRWLLNRRWIVLTPGVMTPELVSRVEDVLRIFPGSPDLPLDALPFRNVPYDVRILAAYRDEPWGPLLIDAKILQLQRLGSGRSDAYREMVTDYILFMQALRRNESHDRLKALWTQAEERRKSVISNR